MRLLKSAGALALAAALALSVAPLSAQADDPVDLTPGPHVYADPNSPTGYTGHFVYCNETATSVRFVGDILLRDWENPTVTTIYQPSQYRPGLMRGGGGYDVEMTNGGGGCWYTDVPLAAGANQYWFYVNNNTSLWVADPANSPIYAPDGLTGTARRAFNTVFVPYDAGEAELRTARGAPDRASAYGYRARHVELRAVRHVNGVERTIGVYLPPGYDPDRAEPYKTIYMQHGGGQDQSDWMNMGDVPVIMDNLLADGLAEPAVIITPNSAYLGAANQGYPNLRNLVIPFVEANYQCLDDRTGSRDRRVCRPVASSPATWSTTTPRSSATTASGVVVSSSTTTPRTSALRACSSVVARGTSATRRRLGSTTSST